MITLRWDFLYTLFCLQFWVWIVSNYTKHSQWKKILYKKNWYFGFLTTSRTTSTGMSVSSIPSNFYVPFIVYRWQVVFMKYDMYSGAVLEHYHSNLLNRLLNGKCDTPIASNVFYEPVGLHKVFLMALSRWIRQLDFKMIVSCTRDVSRNVAAFRLKNMNLFSFVGWRRFRGWK